MSGTEPHRRRWKWIGGFLALLVCVTVAIISAFLAEGRSAFDDGEPTNGAPSPGDASRTVQYVALGDSYASGYGGGTVLDGCGRTASGYPALLDSLDNVELVQDATCAGATALTTDPGPPDGPVDLPQQIEDAAARGALTPETDLVTVTIGGNDVRFLQIVQACAGADLPETCAPAVEQARSYAEDVLAPQLAASLQAVRGAAPAADVVVTGYPHLFDDAVPGLLTPEAAALFHAGTDALNAVIAGQLPEGAVFVDVVENFAGHGIGSADPWILLEGGPYDLHPNAAGYEQGYLPAVLAAAGLDS